MVTVEGGWVQFSFYRPQATHVFVAGDFNQWHTRKLKMTCDESGMWTARVKLRPGEFRFRYCADGEWFTDYAAFGVEPGRFGMDSVLRVDAPALTVTPGLFASSATAAA